MIRKYRRLLGVALFLGVLLAIFEFSGLRDHFDLPFIREMILRHRGGGLLLFVMLFALGNLVQIPGWVFLAAAVVALGRMWGGVVTYIAAVASCAFTFVTIRALGGDALRLIDERLRWLSAWTIHNANHLRDRKSTRLNSSHMPVSRMPSSA